MSSSDEHKTKEEFYQNGLLGVIKKHIDSDPSSKKQSLLSHLEEFRSRLIRCVIFFMAATVLSLIFSREIIKFLLSLGEEFTFVFLAPTELALAFIKVSLMGGLVLSLPFLLLEIYLYIYPGLKKAEKLVCLGTITFGIAFFIAGAFFCYKVILPLSLIFLGKLNTFTQIQDMISIASYLEFVLTMICVFGLTFEFPVVSVLLTLTGLLNPNFLRKNRKYVIFATFILAAIITPPDVVTQLLVAIPLLALFEFSINICSFVYKFRKKKKNERKAEGVSEQQEKTEENEDHKEEKEIIKETDEEASKEEETKKEVTEEVSEDSPENHQEIVDQAVADTSSLSDFYIEPEITEMPEPVPIDPEA